MIWRPDVKSNHSSFMQLKLIGNKFKTKGRRNVVRLIYGITYK